MNASRKRHVIWTGGYQGATLFLSVIRGILLVPFYLQYLSLVEYGYWVVIRSISSWLFFIDPGFASLARARSAKHFGEKQFRAIWNDTVLAIYSTFAISVIVGLGAFGVYFLLPQLLGVSESDLVQRIGIAFIILALGGIIMLFAYVLAAINDGLQQGAQTGACLIIANGASIIGSVAMLIAGWGINSLALAYVIMPVIYLILVAAFLRRNLNLLGIKFQGRIEGFREFMGDSVTNFRGRISSVLAKSMDRWLVARFLGPEVVVAYDFLKRLPETGFGIMTQMPHAFASSVSSLAGEDQKRLGLWGLRITGLQVMGCISAAAVALSINREFISLWVGEGFYTQGWNNLWIVCWLLFASLLSCVSVLSVAAGHIKEASNTLFIYSVGLIPFLIVGITWGGLHGFISAGAVWAALCYGLRFRRGLVKSFCFTSVQNKKLTITTGATGIVGVVVVLSAQSFPADTWPILIGKTLLICITLTVLNILISPLAREGARALFRQIRR